MTPLTKCEFDQLTKCYISKLRSYDTQMFDWWSKETKLLAYITLYVDGEQDFVAFWYKRSISDMNKLMTICKVTYAEQTDT